MTIERIVHKVTVSYKPGTNFFTIRAREGVVRLYVDEAMKLAFFIYNKISDDGKED